MSELLPTYQLQAFCSPHPTAAAVYFPDYGVPRPALPLHQPYRGDYYKISLCIRGTAEVKINLETYIIGPGCLVLATPEVIKQWLASSPDYETLSVFFTRDFITAHNAATGRLRFLVRPVAYVQQLTGPETASITASLRFVERKYRTPHAQRDPILQSLLTGLLFELAPLYDQPGSGQLAGGRCQQVATAFRQLVQVHCPATRSVQFYADQLCLTVRYLTVLVKAATGRPPSRWIAEAVALEAKALLQNPALSVQQVATHLHFADQFAFSRFFKHSTGYSPTAYRQVV